MKSFPEVTNPPDDMSTLCHNPQIQSPLEVNGQNTDGNYLGLGAARSGTAMPAPPPAAPGAEDEAACPNS